MKVKSYYEPKRKRFGEELLNGDIVYCRHVDGEDNFYGMFINGYGVVNLEKAEIIPYEKKLHIDEHVGSWSIERKFNNVRLIVRKDNK